jgi:hypothetical protein
MCFNVKVLFLSFSFLPSWVMMYTAVFCTEASGCFPLSVVFVGGLDYFSSNLHLGPYRIPSFRASFATSGTWITINSQTEKQRYEATEAEHTSFRYRRRPIRPSGTSSEGGSWRRTSTCSDCLCFRSEIFL